MKKKLNYVYPIIKPVGSRCNLNCTYCYYNNRSIGNKLMSYDILEDMIKELLSYNTDYAPFLWHGGEALLAGIDFFEKVVEFQKKYRKPEHRIKNMLQTNGTLINQDWIKFFKKNDFGVGISLDGPKFIHDYYRSNSFDALSKTIALFKENSFHFGAICVVNSLNVKYPEETYHFLRKTLDRTVSIKPCIDMSEDGIHLTESSVDPIEYAKFMNEIFDIWFKEDDPTFMIREFENFILGIIGAAPLACVNRAGGCQRYITINHDGNVYNCDSFVNNDYQEFLYGNIATSSFEKLLKSTGIKKTIALEHRALLDCSNCKLLNICGGGCTNFHIYLSNEYAKKYCISRKIMINHIKKFIL